LVTAEVRFEQSGASRDQIFAMRDVTVGKMCLGWGGALLLSANPCWSQPHGGPEAAVSVDCADWAPESRAQVEARIRASLLLEERGVRALNVVCAPSGTAIEIVKDDSSLQRPVERRGGIEDDVVDAVEKTLQELPVVTAPDAARATPLPATQPLPVAQKNSKPPKSTAPIAVQARAPPPPDHEHLVTDLELRALAERWSSHWAFGAQAGLFVRARNWQYGLEAAGCAASGEPSTFHLSEWNVAGRLQLRLPQLAGIGFSLSMGASALVASPSSSVVADSSTFIVAPYAKLSVVRPFWLGAFGIGPAIGARVFGSERVVRVDGATIRTLPVLVPEAALVLLFELPN
jgi:hypothetical protein